MSTRGVLGSELLATLYRSAWPRAVLGPERDQLSHTPSPPEPVFLISPSGCQSQPSRADKARADTCGWTFLNSEVERVQESAIYARYLDLWGARKARGD